ncbi:MAG TPA: hypothetical protein VD993_07110 [Chitinophagaceae bacterium]|nr:hypothetical protein [Chitinophagaceae bacterium]
MANSDNRTSGQDIGRNKKDRAGDTGRTSSQGRKQASGGSKETDNQGRPTGDNPQTSKADNKRKNS